MADEKTRTPGNAPPPPTEKRTVTTIVHQTAPWTTMVLVVVVAALAWLGWSANKRITTALAGKVAAADVAAAITPRLQTMQTQVDAAMDAAKAAAVATADLAGKVGDLGTRVGTLEGAQQKLGQAVAQLEKADKARGKKDRALEAALADLRVQMAKRPAAPAAPAAYRPSGSGDLVVIRPSDGGVVIGRYVPSL